MVSLAFTLGLMGFSALGVEYTACVGKYGDVEDSRRKTVFAILTFAL
jgi:hypothetical protein